MTTMTITAQAPATTRPKLVSHALLIRFVSIIGSSASFYLMLSVVPLYARSAGASTSLAGLATTALSLSTTAGYLPTPRLVARYGHRAVLAAGLTLLGAPALVLVLSANQAVIMAVCVVRGIGFAITCVSGGALTVSLIPPERRGEGLALVGIVSGIPSVAALPLGVWLAGHIGYRPVFVAAALAALAPLASLSALPGAPTAPTASPAGDRHASGIVAGLRVPGVVRLAIVFGASTMAVGILVTFLPLAAGGAAAPALLCQPAAAIGGRWLAGRLGDRNADRAGTARLLVPGVLLTATGFALLSQHSPAVVMAGALLFGVGFGITQNVSLTRMYDLVPESGYSAVSAVWNLAYDAGMGIGAAGFGVLAGRTGYPGGFVLTAVLLPIPLVLIARGIRRAKVR